MQKDEMQFLYEQSGNHTSLNVAAICIEIPVNLLNAQHELGQYTSN
jgi:hypothetical protein